MEMNNKFRIFPIILLVYLVSYCFFAFEGNYRAIAYGAYERNGRITIESKKMGQIWQPDFPDEYSSLMDIFYFPLIHLDRLLVHRKTAE
jgi:hypothetical protein